MALTPTPLPQREGLKLPFALGEKRVGDEGIRSIFLNSISPLSVGKSRLERYAALNNDVGIRRIFAGTHDSAGFRRQRLELLMWY